MSLSASETPRWPLLIYAAVTAYALSIVPNWQGFAGDPCLWAAVGALNTLVLLVALRWCPAHWQWLEPLAAALFLAGMPLIYLARCIVVSPDVPFAWVAREIFGVVLFVGLAWFGYRRSPWLLVAGIAGHGLGWDIWHVSDSHYMPSWYARACLYLDVALAGYCALRIPYWRKVRVP